MKNLLIFILIYSFFLSCKKQNNKEPFIPVKLSLLVISPYEKRYDSGYALEAHIINNQQKDIVFLSPIITLEEMDSTGKWRYILDQIPEDFLDRKKFFPNELRTQNSIEKYDQNYAISNTMLNNMGLSPIQPRNLWAIRGNGLYMTFLKKDSIETFSRSINTIFNISSYTFNNNIAKGKYRAFCKIKEKQLFHTIKLWNDKNQKSEYELPNYWGKFKFIKEPKIKSDTIYFEIF